MNYTKLFDLLKAGDEQQLIHFFPTLAQIHTPIFDTLTWGEVYPLLTQWLRQHVTAIICTNDVAIGKVSLTEWLFTLTNGKEMTVCCLIDPTTTHGMDVRVYHSFVPLFDRNQSREAIPLQSEAEITCELPFALSETVYYLPGNGRAALSQKQTIISDKLSQLKDPEQTHIFTCWQTNDVMAIEYETNNHQIGIAIIETDVTNKVIAIRQYNDWEN